MSTDKTIWIGRNADGQLRWYAEGDDLPNVTTLAPKPIAIIANAILKANEFRASTDTFLLDTEYGEWLSGQMIEALADYELQIEREHAKETQN